MAEARRLYPDFDLTRSWDMPDIPIAPGDESLESYLRRAGFTDAQLDYTRRSFGNATGDSPQHTSAQAARDEWTDTEAGAGDFRILNGYCRIIDHLADGLPVRLNTPVASVDWSGSRVHVQAVDGTVFEADQAVITLPVGVLQSGSVTFTPALPEDKLAALDGLRMGPVIKMVYRFDTPVLPDGVMALYSALNPPMWWSPSFGQDTNTVVITAFVSGDSARDLLALGEAGALAKGIETLRAELGRPDLTPVASHLVNWPADPYALGGYSTVRPGHADARLKLAQPVGNRLYWAGEATVKNAWGATVHGAYVSGLRAAQEILSKIHAGK
jgi:monoamine oxidase